MSEPLVCVFGPAHEPFGCQRHPGGVRLRLDDDLCSVIREMARSRATPDPLDAAVIAAAEAWRDSTYEGNPDGSDTDEDVLADAIAARREAQAGR